MNIEHKYIHYLSIIGDYYLAMAWDLMMHESCKRVTDKVDKGAGMHEVESQKISNKIKVLF